MSKTAQTITHFGRSTLALTVGMLFIHTKLFHFVDENHVRMQCECLMFLQLFIESISSRQLFIEIIRRRQT